MKEKIVYTEENAFNLLSRLIRVFPFKVQVDENLLNYYRNFTVIDSMAKRMWFAYVFDSMNKKSYEIGLNRFDHCNFQDYMNLMGWITEIIINRLKKIEKKPKNELYIAKYDFLLVRVFFQALFNYLVLLDNDLKNLLGTSVRRYKIVYSFIGQFPDDFIIENLSKPEDFCNEVNKVLKYFGFENFSLFPDGVFRYQNATAESEEIKIAYGLLNKGNYDNVIQNLDDTFEIINSDMENKGNIGLDRCRVTLESFFKRFLRNHKINELIDGNKTEKGTINPLAETVKKNIEKLFIFPNYSKNMELGIKQILEASKYMVSGLADDGGAHGKSVIPKVQIKTVRAVQSFLFLLFNSLLPFES